MDLEGLYVYDSNILLRYINKYQIGDLKNQYIQITPLESVGYRPPILMHTHPTGPGRAPSACIRPKSMITKGR